MTNSSFDLLKNFPTWSTHTPQQQYDYAMSDPGFQQAYLEGDMVAKLGFETMTKNMADYQPAERAKTLAEAQGSVPKASKSDELRARLNEMAADPKWRDNYFKGEAEAVQANEAS